MKTPAKKKTEKKTEKSCDCVEQVDNILAAQGARLVTCFTFPDFTHYPTIATERVNAQSRVKLKTLTAAYCPFCGKAYPKRATKAA